MKRWRNAMLVATTGLLLAGGTLPASSQQRSLTRPAQAAPAPQCDAAKFRVIVDVGHTPEIPGAISARGATEYDFNLRLAKVIERKLNDSGYARTSLLLATGPAIPSLVRRVAQANQMSADLLISIHHQLGARSLQGEVGI